MASHQRDKKMLSATMICEDLLLCIAFLVVKRTLDQSTVLRDGLAPTTKRRKLELIGLSPTTWLNSLKL